jgi:hypothetical protein
MKIWELPLEPRAAYAADVHRVMYPGGWTTHWKVRFRTDDVGRPGPLRRAAMALIALPQTDLEALDERG